MNKGNTLIDVFILLAAITLLVAGALSVYFAPVFDAPEVRHERTVKLKHYVLY